MTQDGGQRKASRRSVLKKGPLFAGTGLAGISVASGDVAAQQSITSCTVIDESGEYVLQNDISHSGGGSCIEIRVGGVTLDGGGHIVSGDGSGTGIDLEFSFSTMDDVTIRDVTVTGFADGVRITDFAGTPVVLERCHVVGNGNGIEKGFQADVTVRNGSIDDNAGHAIVSGSRGAVTVVGSTLDGNGGMAVTPPGDDQAVTVANSTVRNNGNGVVADPVLGDSKVTDSVVAGNEGFGVALAGSAIVPGETVPVVGNEIRDNGGPGIEVVLGDAVVRKNGVENNGHGVVVRDRFSDDLFRPTAEIHRNNVVDNDGYGVLNELAGVGPTVDATCNYWGHATGPRHEDNPRRKPKGDRVSDDVEFVPWSVRRIRDGEGTCVGGRGGGPGNRGGGNRGGGRGR